MCKAICTGEALGKAQHAPESKDNLFMKLVSSCCAMEPKMRPSMKEVCRILDSLVWMDQSGKCILIACQIPHSHVYGGHSNTGCDLSEQIGRIERRSTRSFTDLILTDLGISTSNSRRA